MARSTQPKAAHYTTSLPKPASVLRFDVERGLVYRTNLDTRNEASFRVLAGDFASESCWSELPGGSLVVTGGRHPTTTSKVTRIDTLREFAVTAQPAMATPRCWHSAVYHALHLYILGGMGDAPLSECERYVCTESRWEALPPLPTACAETSGIVSDGSLYALGGYNEGTLALIQRLSLEGLTWKLLQVRLPYPGCSIACFKVTESRVYLVLEKTLYSFTPQRLKVHKVKKLPMYTSVQGPCWYSRGLLHFTTGWGVGFTVQIGGL